VLNRCALCRVKLHLGLTPFALGVEAAHIRWFADDGPDHVTNGIAFCAFHGKAFDLGAFTVEEDSSVLVAADLHGDGDDVLLRHKALAITPPGCKEDRQAATFLAWHKTEVFWGKPRS
jgi:putative restriction endonuclease